MKISIRLIVGLLGALLVLWTINIIQITENIQVLFQQKTESNILYQVFYTTPENSNFSQSQSVTYQAKSSETTVKIVLPVRKINKFRLDFGRYPQTVTISDLKLIGHKNISLNQFNNFNFHEIDEKKESSSQLTITSHQQDPYIVYKEPLNLKAGRSVHFQTAAFILLPLFTVLIAFILKYIVFLKRFFNKRFFQVLLTLLFTSGVLFFASSYYLSKEIYVSFNAKAAKDITYQVFYTTGKNEHFQGGKSVSQTVKAGQNHVQITLPVSHLYRFRLDFDRFPEHIEISDLKVKGKQTQSLNFSNIKPNELDSFEVNDNKLTLYSNKSDPYIIFMNPLNTDAASAVNYCFAFIVGLLSFLFFYKISDYILKILINLYFCCHKKSIFSVLFLTLFFTLLFLPMTHISQQTVSDQERRSLASKPLLFSDKKIINTRYGFQFDNWYNDHFFGRSFFVQTNRIISYLIKKNKIGRVYLGKDNFLFSTAYNMVERVENNNLFKPQEIQKIQQNLINLNDWAQQKNIQIFLQINPDKETIYEEYLPDLFYKKNPISRREQFLNNIKSLSNITVVSSENDLFQAKKKSFVYPKTGTHPNSWGAYTLYRNIITAISEKFPEVLPVISESEIEKKGEIMPDTDTLDALSVPRILFGIKDSTDISFNVKRKINMKINHETRLTNHPTLPDDIQIFKKSAEFQNLPKLFIIGDSFVNRYGPYLHYHFGNTVKVFVGHGRNYALHAYKDKIDELQPDIILVATTERFLERFLNLFPPQKNNE